MHSNQIPLIAQAAEVIRSVIGCDFEWDAPLPTYQYVQRALIILKHEPGSTLRAYCNYDCEDYKKIDQLTDALSAIGLYVEDCTGDYSGLYEVSK